MPTYNPPTWLNTCFIEGSMYYGVPTSKLVYKKAGQWRVTMSPGIGELDGADYIFTRPTSVTAELATEILASGVGGTVT